MVNQHVMIILFQPIARVYLNCPLKLFRTTHYTSVINGKLSLLLTIYSFLATL